MQMKLKGTRWPSALIAKIEAYRKEQGLSSWSEALRHIVTMFFKKGKR